RCCAVFFFQAEDGIRDFHVTGVQTCALPICLLHAMTVPAAIAKGEIEVIDTDQATRVPGVVRVFTWRDFTDIRETPATRGGGGRSEERRVGKECRARWWRWQ